MRRKSILARQKTRDVWKRLFAISSIAWAITRVLLNLSLVPFLPAERLLHSFDTMQVERYYSKFRREEILSGRQICGCLKCIYFIRDEPDKGIVIPMVGRPFEAYEFNLQIESAWRLSKVLDAYELQHTSLAPPRLVDISPSLASWLVENRTFWYETEPSHFHEISNMREPNRTYHYAAQLVKVVSQDSSVIVGAAPTKYGLSKVRLLNFFNQPLYVSNSTFLVNFQKDVANFERLVATKRCLIVDLQFFLLRDGHLVHFDLDRCFECNTTWSPVCAERVLPKLKRKQVWKAFHDLVHLIEQFVQSYDDAIAMY